MKIRQVVGPSDEAGGGGKPEDVEVSAPAREMRVLVRSAVDVVIARSKARSFADASGLKSGEATIVATLMSGVARHVLRNDGRGEITVTAADHIGYPGVIIRMRHERQSVLHQWPVVDRPGRVIHELELFWDGVNGMTVRVKRWSL